MEACMCRLGEIWSASCFRSVDVLLQNYITAIRSIITSLIWKVAKQRYRVFTYTNLHIQIVNVILLFFVKTISTDMCVMRLYSMYDYIEYILCDILYRFYYNPWLITLVIRYKFIFVINYYQSWTIYIIF